MTLNDLQIQKRVFSDFWRFKAATRISTVNCAETTIDKPGHSADEIFSIPRKF